MKFEEFIQRPGVLNDEINQKEATLESMKAASLYAVSDPSQTPSGNPHYDSVIEKHIARINELEQLIPALKQERAIAAAELSQLLSELKSPRQIKILTMRYLQRLEYSVIIDRIGYSKQTVFRDHENGLAAAKKIYIEKYEKRE